MALHIFTKRLLGWKIWEILVQISGFWQVWELEQSPDLGQSREEMAI